MGRTNSHSSVPERHNKRATDFISRSFSDKDMLCNIKDRSSFKYSITSALNTLEYTSYPQSEDPFSKTIKNWRPTSLVIPKAVGRSTPEKSNFSEKDSFKIEGLQVPGKGIPINKPRSQTPSHEEDSVVSTPEYFITPNNNQSHHSRQCSTDTYLHLNDVTIDSSSSGQTMDLVDAPLQKQNSFGSFCSDDNTREYHSIPEPNSISIVEVRNKLEETCRQETFLRKRRNSLNLERDHVKEKIDELKETNKRSLKDLTDQFDRTNQIGHLENKMIDIDQEIKNIDKKMNGTCDQISCCVTKKRKPSIHKRNANNIMTKFRGVKPNIMAHSYSVESLTSTASHDSSIGRESPYSSHKRDTDRHSYIPSIMTVRERTSDDSLQSLQENSSAERNGLEELMLTTQKLENREFEIFRRNEFAQLSSRSKSMPAVDKIHIPKHLNTRTLANADLIIEVSVIIFV